MNSCSQYIVALIYMVLLPPSISPYLISLHFTSVNFKTKSLHRHMAKLSMNLFLRNSFVLVLSPLSDVSIFSSGLFSGVLSLFPSLGVPQFFRPLSKFHVPLCDNAIVVCRKEAAKMKAVTFRALIKAD